MRFKGHDFWDRLYKRNIADNWHILEKIQINPTSAGKQRNFDGKLEKIRKQQH